MKIRCGSHQQNRSIVRPGLSLMATKVALTAEEFRENSQRSIALFNTEKLSTNSTHVLKSAYCNSVHFCSCNLHGACGGKGGATTKPTLIFMLQSARGVWRQRSMMTSSTRYWRSCNLHGACGGKVSASTLTICGRCGCNLHGACGGKGFLSRARHSILYVAICTGRVEAKRLANPADVVARSCNLHGACGGKVVRVVSAGCDRELQSARGVWRQSVRQKHPQRVNVLQSARGVWRQSKKTVPQFSTFRLQSARGVWRQSPSMRGIVLPFSVAICTGRVEAKVAIGVDVGGDAVAICTGRVEAKLQGLDLLLQTLELQSARGVWRQSFSLSDSSM